jgi:hypothetical protein
MRIYFIPYLYLDNADSSLKEHRGRTLIPKSSKPKITKIILPIKPQERGFAYPKSYLSEKAKSIINAMLFGFQIFNITFEDGIIMVQAELDIKGKMMILDYEDKNIKEKLYEYFYINFIEKDKLSGGYEYRGIQYKLSLIFIDIEI